MFINRISITNFKSIYGTEEFDFRELCGLNKLTGPIGSGKTTLCEAILYGLYGKVRNQKIPGLVAWNTKEMEVDIELKSNGKLLYIKRGNTIQTELYVDGRQVPAPSKRDMQEVINSYYDVPQLFVEKMCIISFDASKMSLASMSPAEAKMFMDDVFGLSLLTDYSDVSKRNKYDTLSDIKSTESAINVISSNIENIKYKMKEQLQSASDNIDINTLKDRIEELTKEIEEQNKRIDENKSLYIKEENIYKEKIEKKEYEISSLKDSLKEVETLGKVARKKYNSIKDGKCVLCGHDIPKEEADGVKLEIDAYTEEWKKFSYSIKEKEKEKEKIRTDFVNWCETYSKNTDSLYNIINKSKEEISHINGEIRLHDIRISQIKENYSDMLEMSEKNMLKQQVKLSELNKEYCNWDELTNLLSSKMRFSLLENIIPNINAAIASYVSCTGLPFFVEFDATFKSHIRSSYYKKEISYSQLSTGQKKSVDMSIIFGILSNIISKAEFNVIILDELFSNMDADIRNTMIDILKRTNTGQQSVFVINHSDMDDSWFDHKIQVRSRRDFVTIKTDKIPINKSIYNIVF